MAKYEALRQFLTSQRESVVPMTFAEIERVIGHALPPSRRYPAWWSNNPSNNPMTKEWLAAGFTTERVDVSGHKVVFRRAGAEAKSDKPGEKGQHPLIGCMAGTVTIAPGVDLTAPSEWADYLDEVYGPEPH